MLKLQSLREQLTFLPEYGNNNGNEREQQKYRHHRSSAYNRNLPFRKWPV